MATKFSTVSAGLSAAHPTATNGALSPLTHAPANDASPHPPPASGVRLVENGPVGGELSDAALVRAALRGDPAASPTLWRRYRPLVRRRLRAYFAGPEIDDHVQEVFARCFQSLPRLRDPEKLRSFLIGIALRLALLECRRRRFQSWLAVTPTGELPETAVSDDIEGRLVAARTRALCGRLKADSYHVLELRFICGQELTEVAETMGVSLATAKRHLAKASARMRAMAEREPVVAEYVRERCAPSPCRRRAL